MVLERVLHTTRIQTTAGWRDVVLKRPLTRLVLAICLVGQAASSTAWAQVHPAPPITGVIGTVQSFTASSLDLQTPSGLVDVSIKRPLTTYKQIPADLSRVAPGSYVGVASVEQADGKQVATQIIIFPADLRGAAEGSVLTDAPGATTHSRMTNGSVSRPAISHSRMTNGTIRSDSGTTLLIQYQGGSKTMSVPSHVPVVEVTPRPVTIAPGDMVYAATETLADGTLTTDKILLLAPAVPTNGK